MQGFGIQTKNIDELIKKIEQEIAFITKNIDKSIVVLNNKLSYCSEELARLKKEFADLQTYTESALKSLELRFEVLSELVEDLRKNCIYVEFNDDAFEDRVASGIAPLDEYKRTGVAHPLFAKYAENDVNGDKIDETYIKYVDSLSATKDMYKPENKEKLAQAQAITGMMSVSGHQLILGF